jgi:hypothetical protein
MGCVCAKSALPSIASISQKFANSEKYLAMREPGDIQASAFG